MTKAKFYSYRQNNSGGSFTGPAVEVFVEAHSAAEANKRAEELGLYFNGDGDCPCCGDRWYESWNDDDGYDVPSHYGIPVTSGNIDRSWAIADRVPAGLVYYLNGEKVEL